MIMPLPLAELTGISARDGLLWRNGECIQLPKADWVAQALGYACAEELVAALELENKQCS